MDNNQEHREAAVERVKAKRDFRRHVVVYIVVNLFLIGIWALSDAGFFWPIFVILGWGVGLLINGWDAYFKKPISEEEIQREIDRGIA